MKTKTWKIGERCKGGIITVEIKKDTVHFIGKDWDHSAGDRKSSDQSNAQEWTRLTVDVNNAGARSEAMEFLNDLTISYFAEEIMGWVEKRVKFKQSSMW